MKRTIAFAFGTLAIASLAGAQGMSGMKMMGRYAGPVYTGAPMLKTTVSAVMAGGGPGKFSTAKAITALAGKKGTDAEVKKLTKQYGADKVSDFLKVNDFAIEDAVKIALAAGVKLPKGNLKGKALGMELVKLGLDKDNTYYVEYMLDKLVTHDIHLKVMDDIDAKFGQAADANYHKIANQAYYDYAHLIGMKKVKLASFH